MAKYSIEAVRISQIYQLRWQDTDDTLETLQGRSRCISLPEKNLGSLRLHINYASFSGTTQKNWSSDCLIFWTCSSAPESSRHIRDFQLLVHHMVIALLPELSRAVLYATVHFFVDPVPSKALEWRLFKYHSLGIRLTSQGMICWSKVAARKCIDFEMTGHRLAAFCTYCSD